MALKSLIIGTGLSGMVGSRFTELFKNEFSFVNLDLTTGIDITKPEPVATALAKYPPGIVIHLAAFTDVSRAYQEKNNKKGQVYQVNVVGTKNLSRACLQFGHYLIHVSTDFVFDGKKNTPYTETDKPNPVEWYGQTKYWAEELVQKSGCRHSIVRIAFPFRAKFEPKTDLVRNIIDKLKSRTLYPMFTDQIITPTFIDDLCQGLKLIIAQKPRGIYHLVGSSWLSPYEIARKISQVFQLKAEIKPGSFKEYLKQDPRPRQQFLKISNAKVKKELGITMSRFDSALETIKKQLSL
jgi:dTDP-4-dehydrorhamnose reductase